MNAKNLNVVVFAALVFIFATAAVAAEGYTIRVNVPFDFVLSGTAYPAGHYQLSVNNTTFRNLVLIMGPDGNSLAMVNAMNWEVPNSDAKPHLVFRGYNGRYFLSSLWTGSMRIGVQFPRSREERRIMAALQGNNPTQVAQIGTVTVAGQ
jgi:hypothetical protein